MGQLVKAQPISYLQQNDPKMGGRALNWTFRFSQAPQQTMNIAIADYGLDTVKAVFIDNSNSPAPCQLYIVGTLERISIPAYAQGSFPLFFPGLNLSVIAQCAGAVDVQVQFLNFDPNCGIWSVQNLQTIGGTVQVAGTVVVQPYAGAWTNRNGVLVSAGASQLLMPANGARKRHLLKNPASSNGQFGGGAVLESAYINFTAAAGVDDGVSFELLPGESFDTGTGPVSTEAIYWTAATANHRLVAKEMT